MSHFKHDNPKSNLHIAEWKTKISSAGETYSEILRQKFNLYSNLICPLSKDYMDTRSSEWQQDKESTSEKVRDMELNKYNNLLNSVRWPKKDPKYDHTLYLGGVSQKLADDSKKSSDRSNTSKKESTKGESFYTRGLPLCMLEQTKFGVANKISTESNIGDVRNTTLENTIGSDTSKKITGSRPVPHQAEKEALSHQSRDIVTIIE